MDAFYSSGLNWSSPLEPELTHVDYEGIVRIMEQVALKRSIEAIAARLLAVREALEMDQASFCEGAGIARNTYNQWEKGKGRPQIDEAIKLCTAYSLTLDWVYMGNPAGLPYAIAAKVVKHAKG